MADDRAATFDTPTIDTPTIDTPTVDAPAHPVPTPPRLQAVSDTVGELVGRRSRDLERPLRVLDLGGGTGGLAVPLAALGHHVTVLDPSPDALAALERRAAEYSVADRITARQGDTDSLADTETLVDLVSDGAFDLVCCHGVLEVVDDPAGALAGVASVLAPGGYLSLLVAGRLAVVLARALAGDFGYARQVLTSEDGRWGRTDPLPRRFDTEELATLLDRVGFRDVEVHGVRVFADLVPSATLDSAADRAALDALEREVAAHPRYADVLGRLGAGLHATARHA
ncbi:methyltransferase domain-containing protein [Lapillicoccus sp.]|uniref:methyltransferase domain-containing protein n=1 Tax=Lapillicoccus sp. TaxID=1909287 RepID=UPI003264A623